jgi:hypothetical protein
MGRFRDLRLVEHGGGCGRYQGCHQKQYYHSSHFTQNLDYYQVLFGNFLQLLNFSLLESDGILS